MKRTYEVSGMKCQGCVTTVTEKLSSLKAVDQVAVDLDKGQVTVTGTAWKMTMNRALKGTKFQLGKEVYTL